jgi:predicted TPR repeat methyltransferase
MQYPVTSDIIDLESKPEYRPNQPRRYAHSASYLEKLASDNGFSSLSMISTPVRLDDGFPIPAWAAVWESCASR